MPLSPQLIELLAPGPDEARVLVLAHAHPFASAVQGLLSKQERARSRRFREPRDRFGAATCWGLLRLGISVLTGQSPSEVIVRRDGAGRPHIEGLSREQADLNVSRRRGCSALVLSRGGPCGIDLESIDASLMSLELMETLLSERERAQAADPLVCFFERWCALEAVLKADGRGLSEGTRAAYRREMNDPVHEQWTCGTRNWEVRAIQAPAGFVTRVALPEGFGRCAQIDSTSLAGLEDPRILCAMSDLGEP